MQSLVSFDRAVCVDAAVDVNCIHNRVFTIAVSGHVTPSELLLTLSATLNI